MIAGGGDSVGQGTGVLTLAIETSNPSGAGAGVALGVVRAGVGVERVLGMEAVRPATRHEDDLMPAVARLCGKAGVRGREIGRVAVSVGPGGYTAVRTAVATGKMIAEGAGETAGRCVAVPTALAVALRARDEANGAGAADALAVALAGKGETAWVALFPRRWHEDVGRWGEMGLRGRVVGATELGEMLRAGGVRRLAADRFVPGGMRAAAEGVGAKIVEPVFDAAACLEASVHLPEVDAAALSPVYPREPDAVVLWRKRQT